MKTERKHKACLEWFIIMISQFDLYRPLLGPTIPGHVKIRNQDFDFRNPKLRGKGTRKEATQPMRTWKRSPSPKHPCGSCGCGPCPAARELIQMENKRQYSWRSDYRGLGALVWCPAFVAVAELAPSLDWHPRTIRSPASFVLLVSKQAAFTTLPFALKKVR